MHKESIYKMIFDMLRLMLFCVSCAVFAVPFLFSNGKLCLNMPSNGIILLILFVLSVLFESFDRLINEFKLPGKKTLNIVEVYVFFALIMGAIIFYLVDNLVAISTTAVVCAAVYFCIKLIRLGRILNNHSLG